jgi:hypothetical protein
MNCENRNNQVYSGNCAGRRGRKNRHPFRKTGYEKYIGKEPVDYIGKPLDPDKLKESLIL